jgi:hypothetical protein
MRRSMSNTALVSVGSAIVNANKHAEEKERVGDLFCLALWYGTRSWYFGVGTIGDEFLGVGMGGRRLYDA